MPLRPPTMEQFAQEIPMDRIVEIVTRSVAPPKPVYYLHWDKLFHLTPPDGFSSQEWWLSIKFERKSQYKELPLLDKTGIPFKFVLTDSLQEALYKIDTSAAGRIGVPEQIVNPETRNQYYVSSLIEEAITSSQLEGATTTRQIAKEMIREKRPPRDKSEKMIMNNYLAMQRIREIKDRPLSKELILELQSVLTQDTLLNPAARGRFRLDEEEIVVEDASGEIYHVPPKAAELEGRVQAMCDFANGKTPGTFIHPAIRSIILHFWLAYDHPFVDGNGRTARALYYWSMLHHGFWICEYLSISQIIRKAPAQYAKAYLYTETDENDMTYFILHQMDVLQRALAELNRYVHEKTKAIRTVEQEIQSRAFLNHRQRALLGHALRHPGAVYIIKEHMSAHLISFNTSKADLEGLAKLGLIEAFRERRPIYYKAPVDIEERLKRANS
jgi:Fic family protein